MEKVKVVCPNCDGKKRFVVKITFEEDTYDNVSVCHICQGNGFLELKKWTEKS